jgi:hypothetical protein
MGAGTGAGRGRGSRCHAHAPQRRGASVARRRRRSAGSLAARWRLVPIPWRGGGALSRTRASLQRRREGPAGRGRALPLARRAPLARQSGLHILADVAASLCPQRSDGLTGGRRRRALGTARVAAEDQVLVAAAGERVGCAEPGSDDTPRQDDVAAARGRGWTVRARVCSPGSERCRCDHGAARAAARRSVAPFSAAAARAAESAAAAWRAPARP